jgi:trimethyllysine dioxygenase
MMAFLTDLKSELTPTFPSVLNFHYKMKIKFTMRLRALSTRSILWYNAKSPKHLFHIPTAQTQRQSFHAIHRRLDQNSVDKQTSDVVQEGAIGRPNVSALSLIKGAETSLNREVLEITFHDSTYQFHAQWLHDAQVDNGPSKDASDVFSQKGPKAFIQDIRLVGTGTQSALQVAWYDGTTTSFPAIWLRALAPIVGKLQRDSAQIAKKTKSSQNWLANTIQIPTVSYSELFPDTTTPDALQASTEDVFDTLLQDSAIGIVKIVNLPEPNFQNERSSENTLITNILKQLFGGVFFHPRRGADKTFNVASHHQEDKKRGIELPNYNADKILLPHADHAHYTYPARIQGLYALEGQSENTFLSCFKALETLLDEAPDLYHQLCTAPMATGRVAHF